MIIYLLGSCVLAGMAMRCGVGVLPLALAGGSSSRPPPRWMIIDLGGSRTLPRVADNLLGRVETPPL